MNILGHKGSSTQDAFKAFKTDSTILSKIACFDIWEINPHRVMKANTMLKGVTASQVQSISKATLGLFTWASGALKIASLLKVNRNLFRRPEQSAPRPTPTPAPVEEDKQEVSAADDNVRISNIISMLYQEIKPERFAISLNLNLLK